MVVCPALLQNYTIYTMPKDADDDDVDDRLKSTIPTFQDNKPGTESMHDFKDGLKRHWNGKGSDTLVKIGFGQLGKIAPETMTQDECEELHRDLINWNPKARLCELDSYDSYEYYDEYDEEGEWVASHWTYTKSAKSLFATTVERLNQDCFDLLLRKCKGSEAYVEILNQESYPKHERLEKAWQQLNHRYDDHPAYLLLESKTRVERLLIFEDGGVTNGIQSYRPWNKTDDVDIYFAKLEALRTHHNRISRKTGDPENFCQPECDWNALIPKMTIMFENEGYDAALILFRTKPEEEQTYQAFKTVVSDKYKAMMRYKHVKDATTSINQRALVAIGADEQSSKKTCHVHTKWGNVL